MLLVGWIITLSILFVGLLGLIVMAVLRSLGRWFTDHMVWWMGGPMMMFEQPFTGMFLGFAVLMWLLLGVATVLLVMAWNLARRGEGKRAGILGIVGGTLAIVFSSFLGVVGLLGGIFVLIAARDGGGSGATAPGAGGPASATPGPVAGQWPPPRD